jgi:hypothetical protein
MTILQPELTPQLRKAAVFVTASAYLNARGPAGGVQICTREYQDTIRAAGYDAESVAYETDRRFLTRMKRAVNRRPYANLLLPDLADRIIAAAKQASVVFLNQVDLTPLAAELRRRLPPNCRLVLLSHGLESVDFFHSLRARVTGRLFAGLTGRAERLLGRLLIEESRFRQYLDQVFCLAPFEVEIERWLGSRRVDWLPRTVPLDPLEWTPVRGRLGFVGTLNHPPNLEGLELFLAALAARIGSQADRPTRVRIVGGPAAKGMSLVRRYPWVDYLGPLPAADLRREASTWACFIHPLFCYARGCSTKLAVALGWEIPVLTTPEGCRGYEWREGRIPIATSPGELAELAERAGDPVTGADMRRQIQSVARSTPTLATVAERFRTVLLAGEASSRAPAASLTS